MSPRREDAKINEKVNKSVAKRITKNKGTAPVTPGSTK
jgi:hypothetical protein